MLTELDWFVASVIRPYHDDITAVSTFFIAVLTMVLAYVAWLQVRDTRILQRAYLSVAPLGIKPFTSGDKFFSCDVSFENVGKLPARKTRWFIDRRFSDDKYEKEFPIKEDGFEGKNTISPGTKMVKGGKGIEWESYIAGVNRPGEKWLYVWGEVKYFDGFGTERFTKFCHRYNFSGIRREHSGSGISAENARQHIYGNDAD